MPSQSKNERGRGVESAPSNVPRWEGSAENPITDGEQSKAWDQIDAVRIRREEAVRELETASKNLQEANRAVMDAAAAARDQGIAAGAIAARFGFSRTFLYQLASRVQK